MTVLATVPPARRRLPGPPDWIVSVCERPERPPGNPSYFHAGRASAGLLRGRCGGAELRHPPPHLVRYSWGDTGSAGCSNSAQLTHSTFVRS